MTSRIRAVIDIGTNSVRLLVGSVRGGRFTAALQAMHQPRLGEGVDGTQRLAPAAMSRTSDALGDLLQRARRAGATSVAVIGTSALRDAVNRAQFIEKVSREHGVDVQVLSGDAEASLSFYGAVRGVAAATALPDDGDVFVLDVGGGSTELARGSPSGEMIARVSVDVGAVRMSEQCIASDPPSASDWHRLTRAVGDGLLPLQEIALAKSPVLLAVGGTATTLAAVDIGAPRYEPERVHGHALTRKTVDALLAEMTRRTAAERRTLPTMQPERADIIVAGAFIVSRAMDVVRAERLIVSEADLLLGALDRANMDTDNGR